MAYKLKYEEKYIPDMSTWSDLGTTPISFSRILKINNTLYAFGGVIVPNTVTNKIYSTAWNDPTGWADTGTIALGLSNDSSTCIINDTIYNFTDYSSGSHVWTAPISDPLDWSDTGLHLTATSRDNCALIVTPTHICLCGGWRGAGAGNIVYAPIATPTTFSAGASVSGWQQSGCYLDGNDAHIFGGFSATNYISTFMSNAPAKLTFQSTTPAYSIDQDSAVFHVENRVYVTTSTSPGTNLYHADVNNLHIPWDVHPAIMPASMGYPMSNWIGPDGYAYIITYATNENRLFRSGRKKIYVIDPPSKNGTYINRCAITESGGRSMYTVHCQMGMAPWFTNRRDKF